MMNGMTSILALDIGMKRTGVAKASSDIRIATPLTTLSESPDLARKVVALVQQENATALVIGLPRNLQSEDTEQTKYVEAQVSDIRKLTDIPVYFMDEALTSVQAEKELAARKKPYTKEDVDMLAATYILEDYLRTHTKEVPYA
jgi:putative Holliday junction resolvase